MHPVEVKRRMGESDIAEVSQLLHQALVADGHYPLGEHKWLDLVHGGRTGFAGFVARESSSGPLVGYAQLSRGHDTWGVEVVIRPDQRKPDAEVGISLLGAALREVAREGGGHVHLWVPKPTPHTDAMAETCGLRRGRDLYQMRRPLPVDDDHPRIAVRPFRPGTDEAAWLAVNNRAFAAHPEQGGWSLDTILEREAEAWFDPEGLLLHERDGRLAGSCWTKVHHDTEPPLGEIYVISVDPDFQGLGLGRDLVLAGLDHLSGQGITVGMLYVDADNAPAVHLYRKLGFTVDHTDRAYVTDVPASP
ncbi:MAG TPA: mycothiol synthase [Acidimicrobiales bacterium]